MNSARFVCLYLVGVFVFGCDRASDTAGIDGTGAPVDITVANALAYGTVTETTHFSINGVRYDASAAKVTIDGRPGDAAEIAVGDVARVITKLDPSDASRTVAVDVMIDDAVEGPITSLDSSNSTLVVLGQTVRVTPLTQFDAGASSPALETLAVGQTIEVAGLRGSNGDVYASRIEQKPAGTELETTGEVANHNAADRRFTINGLVVSYAGLASNAVAALRNGDIVEVRGRALLAGGELAATYLEHAPPVLGDPGVRVDIEGFVTTLAGKEAFHVAGVPTRTTSETLVENVSLVLDAKVAVRGTFDSSGTIVASGLRRGGYPGPTSGPHTIVGQAFDAHAGAVAAADVGIFVQQPRGGYSYTWANGRLVTNANGEFTAPNIPDGELLFWIAKPGFVQPCAVSATVPPSSSVQVELVADATLAVLDPPRPLVVRGTTLTGTVFEILNGVRHPVADAAIFASTLSDIVVATTKTDLAGRFFLCNVPDRMLLHASKPGFLLREYLLPDALTASPVDIEVQRQ